MISDSLNSLGDYIGMESCEDLRTDLDCQSDVCNRRIKDHYRRCEIPVSSAEKEFPPPIPWLARTENLPCHMPWVLKRYYSGDGRLIISEEKVRHHEYFRAHRADGRLTLQLVPLDDSENGNDDDPSANEDLVVAGDNDAEFIECNEKEVEIHFREHYGHGEICDDWASGIRNVNCGDSETVELSPGDRTALDKEATVRLPEEVSAGTAAMGGGKCYNYRRAGSNPYMFGMSVIPSVRPVHI